MDSSAGFIVTYDGEALRDHEIDVRDLAPALLAIGKLFEDANEVVNGDRAQVRVHMKASGEGSIDVYLNVAQTLGQQVQNFLLSNPVQAAINLRDLIGIGAGIGTTTVGVFGALKWLKGRKARKVSEKDGQVTLSVGHDMLTFPKAVVLLMESVAVRDDIRDVLAPLQREGIDVFKTRENVGAIPSLEIAKEEMVFFSPPKEEEEVSEPLPDRKWTSAYTIISLTFKEENKWRLSDGQAPINATILDKEFLAGVDRGLAFAKGDALVCEILQKQVHTPDGIRSEYYVLKVIEFKRAPRQLKMFDV